MCINVYIIGMLYEYTFITELVYKGIHRSLDMQDWINSDMEGVYAVMYVLFLVEGKHAVFQYRRPRHPPNS